MEWTPTEKELLEIFPEAKGAMKRALRAKLKKVKERLSQISVYREEWQKNISKMPMLEQRSMLDWLDSRCEEMVDEDEKEIKRISYKINPQTTPQGGINDDDIQLAKNTPISSLVNINKQQCMICIWHDDHHPSMHIKDNHAHCFSCGKNADSIDIYMKLFNCDFICAVKKLIL